MGNIDMLKPSLRGRQKRRDKRLHEELIECYRGGGHWQGNRKKGYEKNAKNTDYENAPKKEGIKVRSGDTKWQDDNLGPLIRFLEKNEGQFWDKVYSKLCQQMDKSNVIGQHLFDHMEDFVETNVFFENGRLMVNTSWGPEELGTRHFWWRAQFYVHPKSGQLLKVKRKKKKRKKAESDRHQPKGSA